MRVIERLTYDEFDKYDLVICTQLIREDGKVLDIVDVAYDYGICCDYEAYRKERLDFINGDDSIWYNEISKEELNGIFNM